MAFKRESIEKLRRFLRVAGPSEGKTAKLFLYQFNISSSVKNPDPAKYPLPIVDNLREFEVPVLKQENLIRDFFKSEPIDFLKIDIEGSEEDLLQGNLDYSIAIEWHKWLISFEKGERDLRKAGFKKMAILKEDSICGLEVFSEAI